MSIFLVADHIISPLGSNTDDNYQAAKAGKTGIKRITEFWPEPFHAAKINRLGLKNAFPIAEEGQFTFLEKLFISSISAVLENTRDLDMSKTVLIISTTKGNIDHYGKNAYPGIPENRIEIPEMAQVINDYFGFPNKPIVVSNACISGVSAILFARRLIEMGFYRNAIVSGGDCVSEFVVSGFQSFKAMSAGICTPYDEHRDGINLGEACATMLISADPLLHQDQQIEIRSGAESNDANHISGPSRSGAGLIRSVVGALKTGEVLAHEIDLINAHGTATPYNDEMESMAFHSLGMSQTPLNSLKGIFGHTLGAAGILESIIAIRAMKDELVLATRGLKNQGLTHQLSLSAENRKLYKPKLLLKTISGFGGCNAAVIYKAS